MKIFSRLTIFLSLILFSCGSQSKEEMITGVWEFNDEERHRTRIIEFASDSTTSRGSAKWWFSETENKLCVKEDHRENPDCSTLVSISDDGMSMCIENRNKLMCGNKIDETITKDMIVGKWLNNNYNSNSWGYECYEFNEDGFMYPNCKPYPSDEPKIYHEKWKISDNKKYIIIKSGQESGPGSEPSSIYVKNITKLKLEIFGACSRDKFCELVKYE